jgi:hypothetical protein
MKKITFLVVFALMSFVKINAQVSSYNFSQSDGTYTEITDGTVLGTATGNAVGTPSVDDINFPLTLPFSFAFNGIAYTSCTVNTNGYLTFGATAPATNLYVPISGTTAYEGAVSAWGGDINAVFDLGGLTGDLSWKEVGVAPNREFVVQYRNFRPVYSVSTTTAPYINFQIRLSETSNAIKIVYGDSGMAVGTGETTTTKQIGLRGSTNSDFNNRANGTTVLFTASDSGTLNTKTQAYSAVAETPGTPSNGLTYSWAPPQCFVPSGLSISLIGTTSATLTWNAVSPAPSDGYEFYYSDVNTSPTASTVALGTVDSNVVTAPLTGLTPLTTYYAWVRGNCSGDLTGWSSVSSFTTLCVPADITATAPAAICGQGSAELGVTTSSGYQSWYAAETGGDILGFDSTFDTPVIQETTSFYVSSEAVGAGVLNIGTGAHSGTDVPYDFANGTYGGMKGQYLFTAKELAAAGVRPGDITTLGVEFTSAGSTLQGFTVQMGTTTLTQFPTPTSIIGGLTTVLSAPSISPAVGISTLPLTTPFPWDGVSNIIISTSWSNANTSNTASGVKYDTTTNYMSQSYRKDSETAANLLAITGSPSSGSLSRDKNRPKIIFGANLVNCISPRVPVVATVTTAPDLTLASSTISICLGSASDAVALTAGLTDYDTFVWSPSASVSGDETSGWSFNPSETTVYTLTASQSSGALCANTAVITVTVNPVPTAITLSDVTVCPDSIQALVATGGLTNTNILNETFSGATVPTGWTASAGNGDTVAIVSAATAGGTANEVKITGNSQTNLIDDRFFNGPINTQGMNSVTLTWDNYLFHYQATYPYSVAIQTSTDGITWHNTSWITSPVTASIPVGIQTVTINNSDVGSATFYISFTMSGRTFGAQNWNIDNVKLDGASTAPLTWSPIANLYTDAAATVPYVANASAATVYFKSNTAGDTEYTTTATNALSCSSEASFTVTVNEATAAPTGDEVQTVSVPDIADATIEDLVVTGTGIVWYATLDDVQAHINALPAGTTLASGSTYFATQTVDSCPSPTALAVTVTVALGKNNFDMPGLQYYPNPVSNVFTLNYTQEISNVEVYNMLGQRVLSVIPNATTAVLKMEALAPGAYIVQVKANNGKSKTIKVIKN